MVLAEWGGRVRRRQLPRQGRGAKGGSLGMRGELGEEGASASLVSANTDGVEPYNGLIRTQSIRRPKRADNLVSLGRFAQKIWKICSKVG